jgi:hypothetical protein
MTTIRFISLINESNPEFVYVDKQLIIEKFPVLGNLLNLKGMFNDVPEMKDNSYLFFKDLHVKSIIFIFKYLSTNIQNKEEFNNLLAYIKKLSFDEFNDAIETCEPLSLFIPVNLYKLAYKPPLNKSEDIYNEYQFFEYIMDYTLDKERSHKILNDYLNNEWVIVEQNINPNEKTNIILRKKI